MNMEYFNTTPRTRGIRNKNPFNIKWSKSRWLGKLPLEENTDKVFEQFDTYWHGIRAGVVLLRNYVRLNNPIYGRTDTINKIINRFAPSSENLVAPYINWICNYVGIDRNTKIKYPSPEFSRLCCGIAFYESQYRIPESAISSIIVQFKLH